MEGGAEIIGRPANNTVLSHIDCLETMSDVIRLLPSDTRDTQDYGKQYVGRLHAYIIVVVARRPHSKEVGFF